jgi:hypothetical protein
LAARTAAGGSDSEGRVELFDRQAAEQEPLAQELASLVVDTTLPTTLQLQQVFCRLGHETNPTAPHGIN